MTGPKGSVRPVSKLATQVASFDSGIMTSKKCNHHPLAANFNYPADLNLRQLLFLRIDSARSELLFSKLPDTAHAKCTRVLPFKMVESVSPTSKNTFQVVCKGAPPVDLEAHDAFSCLQWVGLLKPLVQRGAVAQVDLHSFPERTPPTLPSSPRPRSGSPTGPGGAVSPRPRAAVGSLLPETGVRRGWHVNTGQSGLSHLRRLGHV